MGRIIAAVVLIGAVFSVLVPITARPALACSAGPDFDPVAEASVIVTGRITGWELGLPTPIQGPPGGLADVPLQVAMTVDRVFKGHPPSPLVFLDSGSRLAAERAAMRYPDLSVGVGGCSIFDVEDPSGRYVVLGLIRRADGSLVANRLFTFFAGDAPSGPAYDRALAQLATLGPARLPAAGTGPAAHRSAGIDALNTVVAVGVLLVVAGLGLARVRAGKRRFE